MHFDCQIFSKSLPSAAEPLNHQSWPWLWPWPWLFRAWSAGRGAGLAKTTSGWCSGIRPPPSCPPLHPLSLLPLSSLWQALFWWEGRLGWVPLQWARAGELVAVSAALPAPEALCHPNLCSYYRSTTALPPFVCYSGSSAFKGWHSQDSVLSFLLSSVCTISLWYEWMWVRFPDDSSNVNLRPRPLVSPDLSPVSILDFCVLFHMFRSKLMTL